MKALGGVIQMAECLPNMLKALGSIPNITKNVCSCSSTHFHIKFKHIKFQIKIKIIEEKYFQMSLLAHKMLVNSTAWHQSLLWSSCFSFFTLISQNSHQTHWVWVKYNICCFQANFRFLSPHSGSQYLLYTPHLSLPAEFRSIFSDAFQKAFSDAHYLEELHWSYKHWVLFQGSFLRSCLKVIPLCHDFPVTTIKGIAPLLCIWKLMVVRGMESLVPVCICLYHQRHHCRH